VPIFIMFFDLLVIFFFFFQAEDGIRDLIVTGVQTCALPISTRSRVPLASGRASEPALIHRHRLVVARPRRGGVAQKAQVLRRARSEERRVGKECRSRWGPEE